MKSQQHTINFFKLLAKKLKKEKDITHVEALNEIAKQHGFANWTDCQRQTISNEAIETFATPSPISFTEWLSKQNNRDTPLGDLSRDMLSDTRWPSLENLDDYEDYLYSMRANWSAVETLKKAWKSYKRYVKLKSVPGERKLSSRKNSIIELPRKIVIVKGVVPIHYSKRVIEKFDIGDKAWISWDGRKAIPVSITEVDDRHYTLNLERPLSKAGNEHYLFLDEVRSTPELACLNMVTF